VTGRSAIGQTEDTSELRQPDPVATLVEYWLGELDEAREGQLDCNLLGLRRIAARAAEPGRHAGGIRAAVLAGVVQGVVTAPFVERLAARGCVCGSTASRTTAAFTAPSRPKTTC
jgi:hypothetical protein